MSEATISALGMGAAESSQGAITSFCSCAPDERESAWAEKRRSAAGVSETLQTPRLSQARPESRVEVMREMPESDAGNLSRLSSRPAQLQREPGPLRQMDENPFCGCYPEAERLSSSTVPHYLDSVSSTPQGSFLSPRRKQAERDVRAPEQVTTSPGGRGQRATTEPLTGQVKVKDMYGTRRVTVEQATAWAQQYRSPRVASEGYSRLTPIGSQQPPAGRSPPGKPAGSISHSLKDPSPPRPRHEKQNGSVSHLSPRRPPIVLPPSPRAIDVLGVTQGELEQMVAYYETASPAQRSVFEAQMAEVAKSTFFRAMFEQRAFSPRNGCNGIQKSPR